MIQVYKKNELFIIENTVTDIIYPNLTREEAIVLLKKFDRNEPEHRCDFAIKEDNISFEYASLDDKDKTIAEQRNQISDLEAKLAESEAYIQGNIPKLIEANKMMSKQLAEKDAERELDNSFWKQECDSLQKALAEKEKELAYMTKQAKKFNNEAQKYFEDAYCNDSNYQDKISFAVEQLNLLYKTLTTEDVWRAMKKGWWLNNGECLQLRQTIDNQINELKKEKK